MGLIRFLLALSVLIIHSSPILGIEMLPGYLAVHAFYIISGFYMALIFLTKYEKTERPIYYFFTNRILRLYPLYLLVIIIILLLSILFGVFLGSYGKLQFYFDEYQRQPDSLVSLIVVMLFNISLIGQDIITFFGIDALGKFQFLGLSSNMTLQELLLIPIAWTVSIELFFYMLTPFIVIRSKGWIIGFILMVIILRVILYIGFGVDGGIFIYRFAPTELFWFLLGVLSYKLYHDGMWPGMRYGLIFLAFVVISLFTYRFIESDWLVLGLIFVATPSIFYRLMNFKFDRYLGELAYPLYISHCLFLMIVGANRFPKLYGTGLPLVILTTIFSILVYHYFLQPLERFRASRVK